MTRALLVLAALLVAPRVALAYPQLQPAQAATCADCHLAPAGGGLLTEYGELIAEDLSAGDGDERLLHGAWTPPAWLRLGGDVRLGAGVLGREGGPAADPAVFPMQAELHAHAALGGGVAIALTGGLRGGARPGRPTSMLQLREHYASWRAGDDGRGAYARAGRFMPPYGLRLAEHPAYVRRYGGTPLFGESYGVGGGWIGAAAEVHVTAFVHDLWRDPVEPGDGAAASGEWRVTPTASVGASARYAHGPDDTRTQGGVTGKLWLPGPALLLMAQGDVVRQAFPSGPARTQLLGYAAATRWFGASWFGEVALGHFDEDVAIADLDRDALDVNVHWFPAAHWELVLSTRAQLLGGGDGGPASYYALLQGHYRL